MLKLTDLVLRLPRTVVLTVLLGAALVARREINTRVARAGGSRGPHADLRDREEGGA